MKFALLALVWSGIAFAQTSPPEFEVASLKPAQPGPQGVWTNGTPDGIRMLNMSLKELIKFAYNLKDYQAVATGWMESEKYDVIAKVSAKTAALPFAEKFALERQMTRKLLADRFQLTIRTEVRDLPAYSLVVAKSGSKIKETGPNPGENVMADIRRGHLSAKSMPMSQLVAILGGQLDRPLLDQTGIKGAFDLTLDWAPDNVEPSPQETRPSLDIALQEQLGLRLEAHKTPIGVTVVDHAEKPSAN